MSNVRFVGLDVHAETIAVAVAESGGDVQSLGVIPNRPESIRKLVKKLGRAEALRVRRRPIYNPRLMEDIMRIRSLAVLLTMVCGVMAYGQSQLPSDIHPESLSRLPPVQRADLDPEGLRIYDALAGAGKVLTRTGPSAVTMHSPKAAEPIYALNQVLRKTVAGSKYFELAALVAAREFDQQYEWSSHEPAGLKAGLDQSVIDAVKYNRNLAGLPDKDAAVILLGRAIFRDHKVSPELWARAEALFGRQGAVEIATIMGDYAMAAVFLIAVDQQLPPERKPLLPTR